MDDGKYWKNKSQCAADAIQCALEAHIGHAVISCAIDGIRFDVPKHEPLPLDWIKPRRIRVKPDPITMFDDAELLAESARAIEAAKK